MKLKSDRLTINKIKLKKLSVLLGPNGSGKTTLIRILKEKNGDKALCYFNSKDNHRQIVANQFMDGKTYKEKLQRSE